MNLPPEIAEVLGGYAEPAAIGLGMVAAVSGFLWLRKTFQAWRYRRALARNPQMSLEERREYLWRIEGADEFRSPLSREGGWEAALHIMPAVLSITAIWVMLDLGYEVDTGWVVGLSGLAVFLAASVSFAWKKLNDPPDPDTEKTTQNGYVDIPTEAIHAAIAAGAILALFAFFIWLVP